MPHVAHALTALTVRIAALALLTAATLAQAGAPLAKGQAPGWYRMPLGAFEITALSDGTVDLPVDQLLTNTTPAKVQAALKRAYLRPPVETSVNGYLINTGTKLVLIDAGAAGLFGPDARQAGGQPEGLGLHTRAGRRDLSHAHARRPCRRHHDCRRQARVSQRHRARGRQGGRLLARPGDDGQGARSEEGFLQGCDGVDEALCRRRQVQGLRGETELVPGIKAIATHGHTPGHAAYVVESNGAKLVVWGDLMHVAAVQFPDPSVTVQFDSDSKAAMPQRKKAYADAARKGYFVAIAHVSFPGLGQLRADGTGYRWLPANYTTK